MSALKPSLLGGNNLEQERKLGNFAPPACFTGTASRTDPLLEHFGASYWWRTPVALTLLHGTIEMEYRITADVAVHRLDCS